MSQVVIVKGNDGKLGGVGDKGGRAWKRFLDQVAALCVGDTLLFEWHKPRSLPHHRKFFAKLSALADRQEQFEDVDRLRQWLTVGAGYCTFVPGPTGRMVALPDSIAFHRLDEVAFSELHAAVDKFLWSPHAQAFLWPHLSEAARYVAIDQLMGEFR